MFVSVTPRLLSVVSAVAALFSLAASAAGAVILVIDVSQPGAVTFSATGADAQNDDHESFLMEGMTLIDFFTGEVEDFSLYGFEESDLFSPEGNFPYTDYASVDFFGDTFFFDDLAIFGSGFSTQGFSVGAPALTGSAVADLSGWLAVLPGAGATGDITSGDGISFSGPVIGQYVVVPEPAVSSVLILAGVLLGRRRRV